MKIKVFRKFFATKIQNPGGSSLTKVLTRDCLSLLPTEDQQKKPVPDSMGHYASAQDPGASGEGG